MSTQVQKLQKQAVSVLPSRFGVGGGYAKVARQSGLEIRG